MVESNPQQKRVYVGNLPYKTKSFELKEFFEDKIGEVHNAYVLKKFRRSKGCGIVEFKTVEAAQRAIDQMKDVELEGRKLFVRADREEQTYGEKSFGKMGSSTSSSKPPFKKRYPRRFGSGGYRSSGFRRPRRKYESNEGDGTRVYISNISFDATEEAVTDLAKQSGTVINVSIPFNSNRPRGYAIVQMATKEDAKALIDNVHGTQFMERSISARLDRRVHLDQEGSSQVNDTSDQSDDESEDDSEYESDDE
mmetsp:Transcript_1922/g.2761  ORF Transcript_1922/g.2761 Transcript_1922/m.2761 type:complete len:252 (-) Transcript_1922:65-820(-)